MFTTVYILLALVYVIGGIIILAKNQYPLWGKRIVTGQRARTIGMILLIFGSISMIGYSIAGSFPNRSDSLLRLVIQIIQLGVIFYIYRIHRRYAQIVDSQEGKSQTSNEIFTVREAAHYLKVEEIDILHLIEDGDLKAKAIGGDYRISKTALENYLHS